MSKSWLVLFAVAITTFIVFRQSFNTFFAQDDFILIYEFSQNNLFGDLKNTFGMPNVTHWRPVHNFYFFAAGNLFGKNFVLYHLLSFLIHISAALLIYKVVREVLKDDGAAIASSLIYSVHPAHFVTLSWISGGATTIGFLLLLISFYSYLREREKTSLVFFLLSLFASEAMLAGVIIFFGYDLFNKKKISWNFLSKVLGISTVFVLAKIFLLTPPSISDAYKLEFSPKIIKTLTYYLLRIVGFGDVSSDVMESFVLVLWLVLPAFFLFKNLVSRSNYKEITFYFLIIAAGLFPFIFLPDHLSPHYMNISIFAFALLVSILIKTLPQKKQFYFLALFALTSFLIVNKTYNNNWLVQRSQIAKKYIDGISKSNVPAGSTIVFNDNYISTSQEAYFALGTGKAIDFWFKDKNYKSCFAWLENCESVQ